MPGTTPTFKFPFPVGGDPINKGAETVEALARAVEAKIRTIPGVPLAESVNADPATLALRDSAGRLRAADPAAPGDVTTRAYVDARPAMFSGAGAPPATLPGARVGDLWWNTATGDVSKITAV